MSISEKRKRECIELARKLASLIQRNIPQPGAVIHLDWRNFGSDLMTVISDIFIDHSLKLSRNHWYASRGGVVPHWDIATLQTEIDENNSKPAAYANIYAEVWLLIVSSFGFLLSSFPFAAFELRVNR